MQKEITNSPYPWQTQQWDHLLMRLTNKQLPHALLLHGNKGLGKQIFAQAFAKIILCRNSSIDLNACGECQACQLMASNTHPDFMVVEPEEEGKVIKVEQIR